MSATAQSYYDIVRTHIDHVVIEYTNWICEAITFEEYKKRVEVHVIQIVDALTVVPDDKKQG